LIVTEERSSITKIDNQGKSQMPSTQPPSSSNVQSTKLTRRELLEKTAVFSSVAGLASLAQTTAHGASNKNINVQNPGPNNLYSDLLTRWCDALVTHQISEIKTPGIFGGIMCPLCSRIHGRSSDAIHPLMRMAHTTGNTKYLDAAINLQTWSKHVSTADGGWVNEAIGNEWRGTTVVGVLSLAASLKHHGELLDTKLRNAWTDRLAKGAAYVRDFIHIETGKINYPISATAALMAADQVLDDASMRKKAHSLARECMAYFTKDTHLLFGEGNPHDGYTPMGCRPIDLGYNIEESLPNFALYAKISQDKEVTELLVNSMRAHLEFMLPDGAWDNSWGTRNFKWTYWGTRTGDGCQPAYALMADHDPRFATAALRNAELFDRCTHDGILTSGPHYDLAEQPACIHHTFCHARGFATVLDLGLPDVKPGAPLPRDKANGLREVKELRTWLAGIGPWQTTVTAYDWIYDAAILPAGHASGGALSAVWHQQLGPLIMASVTEYGMMEPSNMQPVRTSPLLPLTPRIEVRTDNGVFSSLNELKAKVQQSATAERIAFAVQGDIQDKMQINNAGSFALNYDMTAKAITLRASAKTKTFLSKDAKPSTETNQVAHLVVPIICASNEPVKRINNGIEITKPGGRVRVTWTGTEVGVDINQRIFHPVPGFQALSLAWNLYTQEEVNLKIEMV
jgi:hypothetical protein